MRDKNKKAILIIVLLLLICFGFRFVMTKIKEAKSDDESVVTETVTPVIKVEPQVTEPVVKESNEEIMPKINVEANIENNIEEQFYIADISDELFEKMKGKSFKDDCTLDRTELRYVHVLHKSLSGETLEGELVVNYHIAEDTLNIFKELYEADYPIEKIRLIDEYDADDEKSMADNNSSSFNFRFVSNTNHISKHGYGLAIDINPLYNPYITTVNGEQHVEPANATEYVDRDGDYDYKITKDDLAYIVFTRYGFSWGGEWKNSKDYQHFEIPSEKIEEWYPNK